MNPPFQTGCWKLRFAEKKRGFWVFFRHEVPILAGCRADGPSLHGGFFAEKFHSDF